MIVNPYVLSFFVFVFEYKAFDLERELADSDVTF